MHTYTHTKHPHFPKPPGPLGRNGVTFMTVTEISDLVLPLLIRNSQPSEGTSKWFWSPLRVSFIWLIPMSRRRFCPASVRSKQRENSEGRGRGKPSTGGWTRGPAAPTSV